MALRDRCDLYPAEDAKAVAPPAIKARKRTPLPKIGRMAPMFPGFLLVVMTGILVEMVVGDDDGYLVASQHLPVKVVRVVK